MKINKKQFDQMIELLKTLKGAARATLLAQLKTAEVYDTDKDGKEFAIEVEIVEKTVVDATASEEAGNEDTSTETPDVLTPNEAREAALAEATATAETVKSLVAAEMKRLNAAHVKAGRKVVHIGTPKSAYAIPERAKRARVKNFKNYEGQEFTAGERAFRFGQFIRAAAGVKDAIRFCMEHGIAIRQANDASDSEILQKDQVEFDNARGGVLVPEEFDTDLIDLREKYGFFRQYARNVTMGSETKTRMRRVGGLAANFVAEQQAGTVSTATWDSVQLVAKKLMAIAIVSNELNADAAINIGDTLADEIAYAFAVKEDDAGFNGDGTSTYGHIVGIRTKLIDINGVDDGGGLVLGAGNAWGELTLANLMALVGRLPTYAAMRPDNAWYVTSAFHGQVMQPLAYAAGGVTAAEIVEGVRTPMFLGYPVRMIPSMPATAANSQVSVLFGSLFLSSDFGDRLGTTIKISEEGTVDGVSLFQTDQMAIRGTERFDINNHSVGTATEAGPIVGLITAAS